MIRSMTGYAAAEKQISPLGKVSVELRSSNHKFLEVVFHLPEGFLSLEDKIRKEIEGKLKRGRLTCRVAIFSGQASNVIIQKELLRKYVSALRAVAKEFKLRDDIPLDAFLHLPGVVSLAASVQPEQAIWPRLKPLIRQAVADLDRARYKEGRALSGYLRVRAVAIGRDLEAIKIRYAAALKEKIAALVSNDERSSFQKSSDITEEIERLSFHAHNFLHKLQRSGIVGKELDFIAQEMQRETNTMGAKSFDKHVSARVVQMKSQIEKIREQVQNVE